MTEQLQKPQYVQYVVLSEQERVVTQLENNELKNDNKLYIKFSHRLH